jgi:hypothetical protein
LLSQEKARNLIEQCARDKEVILPALNGDEVNGDPLQRPDRFIINFRDWSEERARQYEAPFSIVESLVRPSRELPTQKDQGARQKWWLFKRPTIQIYDRIESLPRCFVTSWHTKYLSFSAFPVDLVFTNAVYVFATDRWDLYAVAQSNIHEIWARKYSGALKQDLRYSPSTCFDTFAFPTGQWQHPNPDLAAMGTAYHEHRRDLMLRLWLGLTDIYNLFHAPDLDARLDKLFHKRAKTGDWHRAENVPPAHRASAGSLTLEEALAGIKRLRQLHIELDYTVLAAYGWAPDGWRIAIENENTQRAASSFQPSSSILQPSSLIHQPSSLPDIVLGHDFWQVETLPENDRTRYTITPQARKDLLTRLLKLNHTRAAEEAAAQAPTTKGIKPKKAQRAKKEDELL